MRIVLAVLISVVAGVGIAVGLIITEPWEDSSTPSATRETPTVGTPTGETPQLTADEAIGLVASNCQDTYRSGRISSDATATYDGDGKWTIEVPVVGPGGEPEGLYSWTVDDSTSAVVPLGDNLMDAHCRQPN